MPEKPLICLHRSRPQLRVLRPVVAHIRWDYPPVVRRIIQWANNIAQGKKDLRQPLTTAELIGGGTIGPVPDSPS